MVKLQFVEGDSTSKLEEAISKEMEINVERLKNELKKIRTGRAHTSLVEDIIVECYETQMKLRDISSISTPEAQMIVIQPWDQTVLPAIDKALLQSDMGITPVNDGTIIRLKLPPMTTEKRMQITKGLGKKLNECKDSIRNVRKYFHNFIRDIEKEKKISEDTAKRLEEVLQKITNKFINKAETVHKKKEEEVATP